MEDIKLKITDRIAVLTIHRPDKLNALRQQTVKELDMALDNLRYKEEIDVLIITGSGDKAFVAGADISEFLTIQDPAQLSTQGNQTFLKIEQFSRPVIMAINGYALGGGLELALAGHIRIASEQAILGLPETSLGIFPGYGGTQRLPKLVGLGRAYEMIFTAERITAQQALAIGLVNHVVPGAEVMNSAYLLAQKIQKNSQKAIQYALPAIQACYHSSGIQTEIDQFTQLLEQDKNDFEMRVRAVLGKKQKSE